MRTGAETIRTLHDRSAGRAWLAVLLAAAGTCALAGAPSLEQRYPQGHCGTAPDLSQRLLRLHVENRSRIAADPAATLLLGGVPSDRVVDDVAILDDDGTLIAPGFVTDSLAILQRALALVGDQYDFVTIFAASTFRGCSNNGSPCVDDNDCQGNNTCDPADVEPESGFAFSNPVNIDLLGINLGPGSSPVFPFIRNVINMNDLGEYPGGPDALLPGNDVETGVGILGEEAGHAFGAFINAEPADMLGRQEAHWSFYLQSYGSVLEGNLWVDNGDGTFTTAPDAQQYRTYSQLDQYLMGLRSLAELTDPIWVITAPSGGPGDGSGPNGGVTVSGTRVEVPPQDIVSFNGERDPASPGSPRDFSMAFVLVVPSGTDPSVSDMSLMQQFRASWETFFQDRTGGRGAMHTGLADPVPVSSAFRATPRVGAAPLSVTFRNLAHGDATSVLWDFGDGNTSTDLEPVHTYTTNGDYTVSLTVQGPGGPFTTTETDFVLVDDFVTIFADDCEIDRGWTPGIPADATAGAFERAAPQESLVGGFPVQPGEDHTPGVGTLAWVTGAAQDVDLDGGSTTIVSPIIDTLPYGRVVLRYARWYSNRYGSGPGRDVLAVEVSDDGGSSWTPLERPGESMLIYREPLFLLDPIVSTSDQFRLRVVASDLGSDTIVEAVLDDFELLGVPLPDGDGDGIPDSLDACPADPDNDLDGDAVCGDVDCAAGDPQVWATPDEVGALSVTHAGGPAGTTTLTWAAPSQPGGTSVVYDTVRSGDPSDLDGGAASCLEADGADATAQDTALPAPLFVYLVRAGNACGEGAPGTDSSGAPRAVRSCP